VTDAAYTVSDLTALISGALAARPELEDVLVEGEMSNIKAHASGHLYFTLKDARASVSCVCFRTNALRIPFRPENGSTVIAHGQVQVYEQQGRYQLYVDRLEPSGVGALALAIEQLKKKLSSEGLLDDRLKRPLPLLPRRVVVVTSRTGAALRDVITVMTRRAPCIDVVLSPATVQGDGAAETLVTALRRADAVRGADVILLVRGGGALEDLMAFNSEIVARAIRATRLPVVTGIGHEVDTTVADLAADRRAATPSAAAETVAPAVAELRADLGGRWLRLGHGVSAGLRVKRRAAEIATARLGRLSPGHRIAGMRQDVDRRSSLLRHALLQEVAAKRHSLDTAGGRLRGRQPAQLVMVHRAALRGASERLIAAARRSVAARAGDTATRSARLQALSPLRTLERGYSITADAATGAVVTDAASVAVGQRLQTRLRSGTLDSEVTGVAGPGDTGDHRDTK
jgi:exodeoxyribonuclease VII large subunit